MALDRIFRNASYLMASEVVSKLMEFAFVIIVARSLGPTGFGQLSSALAYVGLYFFLTDLGLTPLAARELAKDRGNARKLIGDVASAKALLNVAVYGVMAAAAYATGYPSGFIALVLLLGLASSLESYNYVFNSVFQGYERLEHAAVARTVSSVVLLAAALAASTLRLDVTGYAFAYIASRLACAAYGLAASRGYVQITLSYDTASWRRLLGQSWPFGMTLVFTGAFMSADVVLVSHYLGNEEAGLYSAASKLIVALGFILSAYNQAVYPALSAAYGQLREFRAIGGFYLNSMLFIAVPMATLVSANATSIIGLAYSDGYEASTALLSALVWWMAVAFVSSPYHRVLEAAGMQRKVLEAVALGTVLAVSLDVVLIPRYGAIAAAYAAALGQLVFLAAPAFACARMRLSPEISRGDVMRLSVATVVLLAGIAYTKDSAEVIRITMPLAAYITTYLILGGAMRVLPSGILRQ